MCAVCRACWPSGETAVSEPMRTRDHSELALRAFGAELTQMGNETRIAGGQRLRAIEAVIPGDISSAAFFLCAAALFPGAELIIEDLLMNPTRARLLDILILMGVGNFRDPTAKSSTGNCGER